MQQDLAPLDIGLHFPLQVDKLKVEGVQTSYMVPYPASWASSSSSWRASSVAMHGTSVRKSSKLMLSAMATLLQHHLQIVVGPGAVLDKSELDTRGH